MGNGLADGGQTDGQTGGGHKRPTTSNGTSGQHASSVCKGMVWSTDIHTYIYIHYES